MPPRAPGTKSKTSSSTKDIPRMDDLFSKVKESTGDIPPSGYEIPREEIPDLGPPPLTKREKDQAGDLAGLYMIAASVIMAFNRSIATNIIQGADEAGYQWVMLARRSTNVKKYVESLTAASVWSKVLAVHVRMLAPGIAIPFGGTSQSVPEQPMDFSVFMDSMTDEQMQQATAMAMNFMNSQPVNDNGVNPEQTIIVDNNGAPIGSAEYQAPPMNPEEYPFPASPNPPNG